ncbi:SLBB domain-containing protein [Amylibacter sp.]|nr:SLBB domain-containing protein [Amylibacter sp.]
MNILILRNVLIFTLLILWQQSFAQSINDANLQKILTENQLLINNFPKQDKNTIDQKQISENQNVANTDNNLQIDLSQASDQRKVNEKSMLMRYFYALIGEDLNIYGSNEFNQPQDDSLLFFNTIGKNYQLAPGDTIQITITGLSPSNENHQVMNDGTITLENVYPLNVNNLNLNQVSKLVLDKISLDDVSAEVFVRLNSARLVTVQISGNVKSPRTIAVPAYTPLSRVIAFSGGISDSGSLRNISLSQIGETTQTVDFYNFLQNASPELDPLIKNGARIFVPFKGPTVAVTGFVNNPGIYELPNDKSEIPIKNLLSISGTSFLPSGAKLKISYFDSSGQIATRLADKNELLKEGEALQIGFIETRDLNISKVTGAVLKDFEIKTNAPLSIKEVLKNGAVLGLDVYTSFALIIGKEVQVINLDEALEDDSITLPVGSDLRLFTKEEYLGLVASDPSQSLDPLVSKFVDSNVTEIYLDGSRIAYVPLSQKQKLYNIKEVLRGGSILNEDGYINNNNIFTSFALIVGKKVQAINLDEALEDDSITLPVGSDLRLFTKEEYLGLVALDPNKSRDPFVSKFVESNVAEIYLDGVRFAYVPVGQDEELYESIKDFYIPSAKTVYDLALLDTKNGVEAFDLGFAMGKDNNPNHYHQKLAKGDRLFIFEDKFFNQLIRNQIDGVFYDIIDTEQSDERATENFNLEVLKLRQELNNNKLKYQQNLVYSKKLLQKSNIIKINLDGELFSILPFSEGMTSSGILDKLKGKLPSIQNEFVMIQNVDNNSSVEIKNINYEFNINQNDTINLISQGIYRKLINSYDLAGTSTLMNDVKVSNAVKVYYDGKLTYLLSPHYSFSKLKTFDKITNSDDFYKLFIGLSTNQINDDTWSLRSYDAATFFSDSENIIASESNIVYMFSKQYIRDNFLNINEEQVLLKDNISIQSISENKNPELAEGNLEAESLDQINTKITNNVINKNIDDELSQSNRSLDYISAFMISKLRVINGAVLFPGTYPLADRTKLKDLIQLAGVMDTKASSSILLTKSIKENDVLVLSEPTIFKLDSLATNETILSGEFYVTVPKATNQAINGFITLSGEFMVPGNYAFSRKESLQEVIQRAGGFAVTAYPLGAVLERKSIRAQEKESNNILAAQLEASVLTLAQSDLEGVGDQIKAVLGFSQQLRNLPTTGRMTINIMDTNDNLYLQDGDKLMLPKRPSHVSVIGAVQRTTVASYSQNKTYKDYIFSAGGLTKMADIRKAYLLLPNGESRLLDNNTVIPVGSVVVVPPKIDKLSILGLTDIISRVMGNIATSILAINNVN